MTPDELRAGLEPLVAGYGAWLDEQEADGRALPAHLQETAELVLWEARQAHAAAGRRAGARRDRCRRRCGASSS